MKIFGLQKTTLLDYPGKIASIVFTGGCNFRCPYCQNSELLTGAGADPISEEEVFAHLKKRQGALEGIVISGGECTLQPDLLEFCQKVKDLGYRIKLDTNGTSPDLMQKLIAASLIDYVAMDIKNCREKYLITAGLKEDEHSEFLLQQIETSVACLLTHPVDYEFRTTVCAEFFTGEDMHRIGQWIKGAEHYYIQPYVDSDQVLCPGLSTPAPDTLLLYRDIMHTYINHVEIRGLDL